MKSAEKTGRFELKKSDEGALTITTISGALYMDYKNDISFLIDSTLNLYEHQSTWNPEYAASWIGIFCAII